MDSKLHGVLQTKLLFLQLRSKSLCLQMRVFKKSNGLKPSFLGSNINFTLLFGRSSIIFSNADEGILALLQHLSMAFWVSKQRFHIMQQR